MKYLRFIQNKTHQRALLNRMIANYFLDLAAFKEGEYTTFIILLVLARTTVKLCKAKVSTTRVYTIPRYSK